MQDFRLFLVSCDRPSSSETSLIQADVLVYYYTPLTLRLAYCFQFFTKSNVIEVFFLIMATRYLVAFLELLVLKSPLCWKLELTNVYLL